MAEGQAKQDVQGSTGKDAQEQAQAFIAAMGGVKEEEPQMPKAWKVVAGGKSGGLLVRDGRALASAELPDRLAKGALVEEIEMVGERLHFYRLSGNGPQEGWVSTKQKGSDLLEAVDFQERAEDEWVYSEEQAEWDYQICAHIMINTEGRGTYWPSVEATAQRTDEGQIHVCCLVCAEAGHMTPMLRVARGMAARDGVWRVTIVSNWYGAEKMKGWLDGNPDTTGKIQIMGYVDGWVQEIQEHSNKYSQAEDGKLHGLQNDVMYGLAWECVSSIHNSEHRPALYILDGASMGYIAILKELDPQPKWLVSVALVIMASCVYANFGVPVLMHNFYLPDAMKAMENFGPPPEQLFPTGIIADEVKLTGLPKNIEDFLAASELPVVYVSMGSQGIFTREQLRRVAAGLRAPGEWRVIWSLRAAQQQLLPGGSPDSLGEDFLVSAWLPQAELLLHPKVKAFMSHCGWGATCEAITSCKPVIAFPLFADQNINAFFMELFGMSKVVSWDRANLTDPQALMLRFAKVMAQWTNDPNKKRIRDTFTAKVLNEDVRMVIRDESFQRGAQMTHFYTKRQKGGLSKFAEIADRYARGIEPLWEDKPAKAPKKA